MANVRKQRDFTEDEIVTGQWVKLSQRGKAVLATFDYDGTFQERDLFNDHDPGITGQWELMNGMLQLETEWEGKRYILLVGASSTGVHSGVENDRVYYKFIHAT